MLHLQIQNLDLVVDCNKRDRCMRETHFRSTDHYQNVHYKTHDKMQQQIDDSQQLQVFLHQEMQKSECHQTMCQVQVANDQSDQPENAT